MGAPQYKEKPKKNKKVDAEAEKKQLEEIKDKLLSVLSDPDKAKKAAKIIEDMLNSR